MFECERLVLPNGLRVLVTPLRSATTTTFLVLQRGGSRAEEERGISHFVEHMCFKGGKKYRTSFEIACAVDGAGGIHNAYTAKELSGFFVKHGLSSGLLGLEILEDTLVHAQFPEEEIEREREVVLEELKELLDDPEELLLSLADKHLLFGKSPLGLEILGSPKTITKISRANLLRYRDTVDKR